MSLLCWRLRYDNDKILVSSLLDSGGFDHRLIEPIETAVLETLLS